GFGSYRYLGHMLYQYRRCTFHRNQDVLNIFYFIQQSDSTYHVRLVSALDDIAAYIDVAVAHRFIYIQWRQAVIDEFCRVNLDFVDFFLAPEADHVGYTGYGNQFTLNYPVLYGGHFPYGQTAFYNVTKDFTRRSRRR